MLTQLPGRKRKVKCLFAQPEDATCLNCVERETQCISQKFADVPEPDGFSDSHPRLGMSDLSASVENEDVTQRLERLERLLVASSQHRQSIHSDGPALLQSPPPSRSFVYTPAPTVDLFDSSAVKHAHVVTTITNGDVSYTPPEDSARGTSPEAGINNSYIIAQREALRHRHRRIAQDLYDLLPSPQLRRVIAKESPGAASVLSFAHSVDDQIQGKVEPTWSLASATWPTPATDPVLIARRLMQYVVCLQSMRSDFDASRLELGTASEACEAMGVWIGAVGTLVANDDELVGCAEGLEVLALLGLFHSEAGHLRRAWAVNRRAINICQLLGVHRFPLAPIRSRASPGDPGGVPSISVLWYRINVVDRFHSLVLGLPIGVQKDAFIRADPYTQDRAMEELEKQHAIVARLIADREDSSPGLTEAYEITKQIHLQLDTAASKLAVSWWVIPSLSGSTPQLITSRRSFSLQVRHYTLLIFLHLPYLLGGNGAQRSSRQTCTEASREILARFLALREDNKYVVCGRMTDYSALIAGMTLVLSYLGQVDGVWYEERAGDRSLIEKSLLMFREVAGVKRDRLATESAETLKQLLPIISGEHSSLGSQPFSLAIPSLGTVKIRVPTPLSNMAAWTSGSESISDTHTDMQSWLSFDPILPDSMLEYPSAQSWPISGTETHDQRKMSLQEAEEDGLHGINTAYWAALSQSF